MDLSVIIMSLIPQWAPNVHPLLVHFPIALFFFAVGMDFLSFFLPESWWSERATLITYVLGAISVVVVFFTGQMAAGTLHNISNVAKHAVEEHAEWATWTLWFFVIYTLVRLIMSFMKSIQGLKLHIVMFLISLVGLWLLTETGDHGGKLVYKYGLNTGHQPKASTTAMKTSPSATDTVTIPLTLKDYAYVPDTLKIPTGKPVKIMLKNTGKMIHEFMAGKGGVRSDEHGFKQSLFSKVSVNNSGGMVETDPSFMIDLKPGNKASISFTLPASKKGTWKMGCFRQYKKTDKTHYDIGMKGVIIVK
ncbi:MAG TPA: DUF2231 domain-containing protein [Balneolaceae bacterium]|nr:DUF2231 domain-containing protein [Balneolaceae bacterium]